MKRVIIYLFLLSSFSVSGQEKTAIKDKRFFIGINVSPDICYRTMVNPENASPDQTHLNIFRDSIEVPKFGYTAGLNFSYRINKRLNIQTGIQYSNKGFKTIPVNYYDRYFILSYTYYRYLPREKAIYISNYSYVDFPLTVNYSFLSTRLQIITSLGLVVNWWQQTTIKIIPDPSNTAWDTFKSITYDSDESYNRIDLSSAIGIGVKFNINDRMNFRAEPTFRYGLINSFTHLWSAGINFGYYVALF